MIKISVSLNDKVLKEFIEAYSGKIPVARVGILGASVRSPSSDKEEKEPPTNAEIGSYHEFGTSKMPRRSFLKEPIMNHFEEYLVKASRDFKISSNLDPERFMRKIGILGERIVLDAFHTGGFGKWDAVKDMDRKKIKQILVESQQLRNSITSDVE